MRSKKSKKKMNGGDIIKNIFGGHKIFGGMDSTLIGILTMISAICLLILTVIQLLNVFGMVPLNVATYNDNFVRVGPNNDNAAIPVKVES